jgi:hypothetical protein
MKTTKFAVGIALCALVGMAMGQDTPKKPMKPTGTPTSHPMNEAPAPQKVEKGGKDAPAQQAGAPDEAAMKAMMEQMLALAPEHAFLKQFVGTWTTDVTWIENGQENKSKGTATFTSTYGGRFIHSDYRGEMMGMPFQGSMLMGYNKVQKKFESVWVDSWSTGLSISNGTADSTGKVFTMAGVMDDPMTNQKMHTKEVTTFDGANKMTFEMSKVDGDKVEKMMTIVYTKTNAAKPTAEGHGTAHAPAPTAPAATKPGDKK